MLALNLRAAKSICRAAFANKKMRVKFKSRRAQTPFRRMTAINLNKMEIRCLLIFYAFR